MSSSDPHSALRTIACTTLYTDRIRGGPLVLYGKGVNVNNFALAHFVIYTWVAATGGNVAYQVHSHL